MTRGYRILTGAVTLAVATSVALGTSSCASQGNVPSPRNLPARTTIANVYFSTGRTLLEDPRVVDADDRYQGAMKIWLSGKPEINKKLAVVQPEATVRSVTLKDGVLTVDWDASVLDFKATDKEKVLAWAGVMEMYGQYPEVKKVRFTVEGKTTGTVNGKDVQTFWGRIGLKGQPWAALRPPDYVDPSKAATAGAEGSAAPSAVKK